MTINRCKLFKAYQATQPDTPKPAPIFNLPWCNEKHYTAISIKNLLIEARVKLPKLKKMQTIKDTEEDLSIEYVSYIVRF